MIVQSTYDPQCSGVLKVKGRKKEATLTFMVYQPAVPWARPQATYYLTGQTVCKRSSTHTHGSLIEFLGFLHLPRSCLPWSRISKRANAGVGCIRQSARININLAGWLTVLQTWRKLAFFDTSLNPKACLSQCTR